MAGERRTDRPGAGRTGDRGSWLAPATPPHDAPEPAPHLHLDRTRGPNNFDVTSVTSQVGYVDSPMTLDVYTQLEQRVARSHGTAFGTLVRNAGDQLRASASSAARGVRRATSRRD